MSIWSWHDSMVTPQTSSRLAAPINVPLAGVGHNALLREPAVLERVIDEYRAAGGYPPHAECSRGDAAASRGFVFQPQHICANAASSIAASRAC